MEKLRIGAGCGSYRLLRRRLRKNGLRALLLISKVNRASYRTCSVHGARRYDYALPLSECYLSATFKINLKFARYDQKELVGIRVVMPTIFSLENGKPHALVVNIKQHLIFVGIGDPSFLGANVNDSHGRIACLLGRILLGCWKFGFHIRFQLRRHGAGQAVACARRKISYTDFASDMVSKLGPR